MCNSEGSRRQPSVARVKYIMRSDAVSQGSVTLFICCSLGSWAPVQKASKALITC